MAHKVTCDRCGDEFPHVTSCVNCDGTGAYIDGETSHPGQCSHCKGTGKCSDPQEGKGFQMEIACDGGRAMILNITVSQFYQNQPDYCGKCLVNVIKESFGNMK